MSSNADRHFVAASLSKLYALFTLYKAAARGEVDLDEEITMRPSDVWAEGTSVLYRYPTGHTMTLRECAQFLIKESDNTAEVMLNRYLGQEEIKAELRSLGAHSTSYWLPNTTTPSPWRLTRLCLTRMPAEEAALKCAGVGEGYSPTAWKWCFELTLA